MAENKVEAGLEKVGHYTLVAVEYVPEHLVQLEQALQTAITAEPDVKAGVIEIVQDGAAVAAIFPTIVVNGGMIAADAAALATALPKLEKLFADLKAFIPVAEKVYGELKTDLKS